MNQKRFANIILVLAVAILVGIGGYFTFIKKVEPVNKQKASTPTQATTLTETTTQNINSEWKVFQDSRYAFQFNYPAGWSVGNQQGTSRVLMFKDEKNSEIITVDTGVNPAVIGVSYCGTYPQDKRCEILKTNSGGYVIIDWNVSGTANAMFSSQDGTYGVSLTLHKINSDTKIIFKKVLLTFKFLN
ncbi:MAG: hypothetical protein WD896_02530 [Parcubacteria group bacterium]